MINLQNVQKDFNKHLAFQALYSQCSRTLTPHYLQALLKLAKS